jgi:hypothetical protein
MLEMPLHKQGEEHWHRFSEQKFASPLNEFDEPCGRGTIELVHETYPVIKHTKCGAWLKLGDGSHRFVNKTSRKRFACPTIEEALESFIRRKQRQITIYSNRAYDAEIALQKAKNHKTLRPKEVA